MRYLGAERVGRWEDAAVEFVKPYWTALGFSAGAKPAETGTRTETETESKLGDDTWVVVEGEKSASTLYPFSLSFSLSFSLYEGEMVSLKKWIN